MTTTERTFVIRDRNGRAEWVDVRKGAADGDLVEVIGNLQAGDKVVRRATDEMREGAALRAEANRLADLDFAPAVQNRLPRRFDHSLVVAAVGRRWR